VKKEQNLFNTSPEFKLMVKEQAFAKINLYLDVLNRRPDGYHNIATVFQSISIFDEISAEIILNPNQGEEISIDYSEPVDYPVHKDLVYKAAKKMRELFQVQAGIRFYLDKSLPMGAGLGGGSADCAAAIRLASAVWGLELSAETMEEIGAGLGADVPFLVRGGTALATGIGERLNRMPDFTDSPWLAVLTPREFVGTAEAYGRLQPSGEANFLELCNRCSDWGGGSFWDNHDFPLFNKFEESVLPQFSEIARIHREIQACGAEQVLLSGSGASVLGFFKQAEAAQKCVDSLKKEVRFAKTAQFVREF